MDKQSGFKIRGKFSDDRQELTHFGKNYETGFLVTGNLSWPGVLLSCQFKIHAANHAGIIFCLSGLRTILRASNEPKNVVSGKTFLRRGGKIIQLRA